jgi:hypothetical protein
MKPRAFGVARGEPRRRLPNIGPAERSIAVFAGQGYWRVEKKTAGIKNSRAIEKSSKIPKILKITY